MSNLNSSLSSLNNRSSSRSIGEFSPSYEKIFVPTNKETVWVYQKGNSPTTLVDEDDGDTTVASGGGGGLDDSKSSSFSSLQRSSHTTTTRGGNNSSRSHFKGEWQVAGYMAGDGANNAAGTPVSSPPSSSKQPKKQHRKPDELWIFRDDDPKGIDERVLQNHPLQGTWGYAPTVQLKKHVLAKSVTMAVNSPSEMWFFPPHTRAFPESFQPLGKWVKPVYHKNLSILSPGQSGFFTVGKNGPADSGLGTNGNWKMYGHNDQPTASGPTAKVVVVKKKKKPTASASATPPLLPKSPASVPLKKKIGAARTATGATASSDSAHSITAPKSVGIAGGGNKTKIKVTPLPTSPTSSFQIHVRRAAVGGESALLPSSSSSSTTFTMLVQPSYKLGVIKTKINRSRGIPLEVIQLSFNGKSIGVTATDDKMTLQGLGIHNGDTIDLAGIQLYVRTPKGKKFLISNVDPEVSVEGLKELVAATEGTPVCDQQLVFLNQLMEDGDSITKYKIKNKSIVELQPAGTMSGPPPRSKKMIVVKKGPAALVTQATVASASTTSTSGTPTKSPVTKPPIAKRAQPTDTTTNSTAPIFASPAAQKKKSAAVTTPKVPITPASAKPKKSSLKKVTTPVSLGESAPSLSLTSPTKKWIVRLIQSDKGDIKLPVDPTDTFEVLQRKAAKKVGLPVYLICLLDAKGREALNNDSFTLVDGSTLRIAPVISILNSQTNNTTRMSVSPDIATVKDLKRLLERSMETPVDKQQLYLLDGLENEDDCTMLDDDAPLDRDMNLRIEVATAPEEDELISVTVKTHNGESFAVHVESGDDERNVREKIAKKAGLSVELLRLVREDDGEEIDRDNYMIKHGDILVVGKPQIVIHTADGQVFHLELEAYETSSTKVLRRKIAKEVGIPVIELRLSKDNRELDDDYRPSHGDNLVIAPPRITIQTPEGDMVSLAVKPGEDVTDLKERIAEEVGVSVSELRLSVNNFPVKDNYSPSYGDVWTMEPPRITVTTPEGRVLDVAVYPDDSAFDIRRKIGKAAGISLDKLNLLIDGEEVDKDYLPSNGASLTIEPPPSIVTVDLPDGEKLEFEAAQSTTIGEIKEILKEETGILESDQMLFHLDGGGAALQDDTIIQEDTNLRLEIPVAQEEEPSTITVTVTTHDGSRYNMDIEQCETSANVLKRKIAKKTGLQVKNFRLSVDEVEVDKSYVAKNGDKFTTTPISKVAIRTMQGRVFNLDIQPDDTAIDFRERISKETSIPEDSLILAVNGEELSRDAMPYNGDLLTIEPPNMTVLTRDGKSFKIDIEINETSKFMRRKIARTVGVPLNDLRLSKEDQELAPNYMPCHRDVLSVMGAATFNVQLPDTSIIELSYSPKMTISDMKNFLEEESGIKMTDQRVFSSQCDECQDDSTTVDDKLDYRMEIVEEPFTITICTPADQILTLDVSSCKCARDLRAQVAKEVGVPLKELRLSKDEEELDEEYMPSHGDNLTVEPPTVTVRLPDGSHLELSASPTTTIADIKEALEDELGILASDQHLLEEQTGELKANDTTIQKNMNLFLEVPDKSITITVNTPDDQVFEVEIAPTDSAEDVRAKIAKEVGISVGELRLSKDDEELDEKYFPSNGDDINVEPPTITVILPNGSVLELAALPTTTAGDLKETLGEETGISVNDQRLYLLKDQVEMKDGSFVKHLMELRLELNVDAKQDEEGAADNKTITIKTQDDRRFSIDVASKVTLIEMKDEVADRVGIPIDELRLFAAGIDDELDDGYLLADGDVLAVGAPTIKVRLPSGDEVELEAMATTTIWDVKETLEEETGISASRLYLSFINSNGNHLEDEMLIQKDLHLDLKEAVDVKVKNVDGNEFSLELSPGKSLYDIRDEIAERTSAPGSDLRLSMDGKELDTKYVPSPGDVLTIESPTICAELPDGTRVYAPLKPTNSIADLKASIAKQSGIPSDSQKITFSQDEIGLADDTLLSRPQFFNGILLRVQQQIPEITVKTHDGRSLVMKMDSKDTKNDVRYKIATEIGIPTQDLRLSKDGSPLERKYKPKHGDILTVEGQRIKVELPDSSRIEISVMPTQLLAEVKDAIEKLSGISKMDQRLFFSNGKAELDDNKAVSKYGLDESLLLEVRLPERTPSVQVKLPDGRTFKLDAIEAKTWGQVKAEIAGELGMKMGTLHLNLQNLTDLDESKTLKVLGVHVKDGDELDVGLPSVEIALPDGSTIQFEVAPKMTIKDLKLFVASSLSGARACDLRILTSGNLSPLDGATVLDKIDFLKGLTVQMEPIKTSVKIPGKTENVAVVLQSDAKIGNLKDHLAREHNLDTKDVLLFRNGTELDDSLSVGGSDITQNCVLEMELFQFQVMVTESTGGDILTVSDISQAATIRSLKQTITRERKIPDEKQLLFLNDVLLDDDQKSILECGIKHKSVLVLEIAADSDFQVSVEHWNGDVFAVDAEPSDFVYALKEKIAALTKMLPEEQNLTFENVEIESGQSLHDLKIGGGSKLKLQQQHIYVTLANGAQHRVPVKPDYTINRVKELLSTVTLLDVEDQNLVNGEEHVKNDSTLTDCGVKMGDTLILEPFSVTVLCWSGEVVELEGIRSKDTIDKVKQILVEKMSVPTEKQRIMRGGAALEDGKTTLASYGVRHKDTLLLDNPEKIESLLSPTRKGKSPFSFLQKATTLLSSSKPQDTTGVKVGENGDGNNAGDGHETIRITVITPELNPIKIEMDSKTTSPEFREKVAKEVGVPVEELRLSKSGDAIDEAYLPSLDDVLTVEPPPTVTVLLPDSSKLELSASPSTTIDDIKDCLEDETGVSKANQKLFYINGKNEEEAPDDMVIGDDIELRLVVPEDKVEHEYEVVEEDEVDYDEETLDGTDQTVPEADAQSGSHDGHGVASQRRMPAGDSAKKYKSKPIEIVIRDSEGAQHPILFHKEATVEELKYGLPSHAVKGTNMADQCILLNGGELDSGATLEECGVTEDTVLGVEPYALRVMHFSSVVLPLESVSRLDTVGTVKEKLALQQSIPAREQRLSIQGETTVLDDDRKTLQEYGVRHMAVLVLQEKAADQDGVAGGETLQLGDDDPETRAKNLDDRIAKIKERAEARKMARMKSGR